VNSSTTFVRDAGAPYGLNLVAAIPCEKYDNALRSDVRTQAQMPQARSIVLVGNGGGSFWKAFRAHTVRHPQWLERMHPLDDFTRMIVEDEIAEPLRGRGRQCAVIYPFMADGPTLNFMELARLSGLAGPSIIGVTLHPVFGPWIAFRAALLIDEEADEPGQARDFDPCPRCAARRCLDACPVHAVSFPTGWNIPECLKYRVEMERECAPRCHARVACVIGPEHRYPDDELAYHQERALRSMREYYFTHIKPRSQE
jgi:hypothetical protein